MTRKHTILTAAVCAGVVLGVTGCGDGNGDGQKSGGGSGSTVKEQDRQKSGPGDTESSSAGRKAPSGVEGLPARDILAKGTEAITSASTLRVSTADSSTSSIDLTMDKTGNCAGTVTTEGFTSRLIRKGDKVWFKPEDAYWNDPAVKGVLTKFPEARGKYMHGTAEKSFSLALVSAYCELGSADGFAKLSGDGQKLTKGAVTTVEGVKAVPVHIDSAKDGKWTAYVATEGRPYIVKADSRKAKMTLLLSDFGKPFTVPPSPPAGETIDAIKIEEASMTTG
ncbi:hypothetical protein [Streptomyces sp. NPDC056641]|uniref:hypothetical protein n=1 Tax=unclassified Streptomyces TaxID=2593676 RepID=UPI00368A5466